MDENTSNSDSDEEFDPQELEVALYSQIHFDSGTDHQSWSRKGTSSSQKVSQPFHVRVKELATRITPLSRKQPKLEGDFISLSKFSNSDPGCKEKPDVIPAVDTFKSSDITIIEKNESFGVPEQNKDIAGNVDDGIQIELEPACRIEDESKLLLNERVESDSVPSKENKADDLNLISGKILFGFMKEETNNPSTNTCLSQDVFSLVDEPNTTNSVGGEIANDKKLEKIEQKKQLSKRKDKNRPEEDIEPLLPFTVTNVKHRPKPVQKVSVEEEKDNDKSNNVTTNERLASVKKGQPNLEDFLELSKPVSESSIGRKKKKKSLTKGKAAVTPRRPPVQVRRPPAVPVRYRQDSDTNTDYSESDVSSVNSSPVKTAGTSLTAKKDETTVAADPVTSNLSEAKLAVESADNEMSTNQSLKEDVIIKSDEENKIVENIRSDDEISSEDDKDSSESEEDVNDDDVIDDESVSDIEDMPDLHDDDTSSSDVEHFLSDTNPELEFNLEGGVDGLLHKQEESHDGRWQIGEKDRYNMNSILSRYFSPKTIQCRNCKKDSHLSRDCPEPLKRRCIFCGVEGHAYQSCPNAICFNCDAPGHRTNECREPKRDWNSSCDRCWMPKHEAKMCPDRWRQFHLTVDSNKFTPGSKKTQNPLIFCYNCGRKGHLGYECRAQRMNRFVMASYPLIARYDTKKKSRQGDWNPNPKDEMEKQSRLRRFKEMDKEERKRHSKGHSRDAHYKEDDVSMKRHRQESDKRDRETKKRRRDKGVRCDDKNRRFERSRSKESVAVQFQSVKVSIPGTSSKGQGWGRGKSSLNSGEKTLFRNVKMSKPMSRIKDEFEEGECPDSNDDLMEDFDSHQVKDNQWWNKQPDKKKRKKNKNKYDDDVEDFEDIHRDSLESHPTSNRFDDSNYSTPKRGSNWHRRGGPRWEDDLWQQKRGNQFLPIDSRDSRKRRAHGNGDDSRPFPGHSSNKREDFTRLNSSNREHRGSRQKDFGFSRKNPSKGGLRHSTSWPQMNRGGHRGSSNRGGFQSKNKRFLSMKNNCDISISLRK